MRGNNLFSKRNDCSYDASRVFLNGKVHNEYRKGLNCLFTRQALGIYLKVQDRIYRATFAKWMADPDPNHKPYQMLFRDLNMETSLRVFCGSYISETDAKEVSDKYWLITQALELVNFPFGQSHSSLEDMQD